MILLRQGSGGQVERDGRRHKLDAGFILAGNGHSLAHLFAKPASSFCHISVWIERRDKSQAQLVLRSFSVVGSSPIQSNPWQEFDGASSVFFVGLV